MNYKKGWKMLLNELIKEEEKTIENFILQAHTGTIKIVEQFMK